MAITDPDRHCPSAGVVSYETQTTEGCGTPYEAYCDYIIDAW
jgi:hypothetical protein